MCLLVGPAGTGKTAVARTLAQLCGRGLVELPLTSGTDTSDLVGGFEQMEPERKVQVGAGRGLLAGQVGRPTFKVPLVMSFWMPVPCH